MFRKKDQPVDPMVKAKAMLKILLRAVIRNNPQYGAAVSLFCDAVGTDPNEALMDLIEKELGGMKDQYLAKDIRDALIIIGMPEFEPVAQVEILKTLCGLAN
jgi:hypothetical protein